MAIYTDTELECKNIILFVYGITSSNHLCFANLIRTSIKIKQDCK